MLSDDVLRFVFVYDARFADALCRDPRTWASQNCRQFKKWIRKILDNYQNVDILEICLESLKFTKTVENNFSEILKNYMIT